MAASSQERTRDAAIERPTPKRDRRPLRYRVGTVVRATVQRVDLACLDGRVLPIRLADRTLFTLAGQRLSGPKVLRPGLEVRVASVDSSRGAIAVLVELLARAPGPIPPGRVTPGPALRRFEA